MKHLLFLLLLVPFFGFRTVTNNKPTVDELPTSFTEKAKYSNKQVTWYEYAYWLDGTLLSDPKNKDKFNDILFKKVGNKNYKAQLQGAYDITDWGVKRDYEKGSSPKENSALIQAMFDYFPLGYTAAIYIPTGNFYFSESLVLDAKPFHVFGDNGSIFSPYSSKLHFPDGKTGLYIKRSASNYQEAIVENICLIALGNKIEWASGINANGRVTIRGCYVKGFSHNGFDIWANMEGTKTDASGSYIEKCFAVENLHDGFFAGRADANAITFIGCDARDNGRYGFNDDSFLGNNFISCMAHYNKKGDYFVRDWGNARSLFMGCYSEGGNAISQLGPKSVVTGGIWGTAYRLGDGKQPK
ncbi:right-handed parallel beta-helix repeat-containing protein [Flavisolibacter tropicus]|uniref:Pectate lyase superfamily protein domain-containing protein n=1 Tax=Flavisolibacter tropicus TaxID=1492898 RepID=A0A172U011_9BACT|nr:right-handed parallel beta-helix repeat-containing protein [Flavisolibacter tropicus]ANE52454.1 hypothetical protein SY85_20185 [Flavisolibacter tropicus]